MADDPIFGELIRQGDAAFVPFSRQHVRPRLSCTRDARASIAGVAAWSDAHQLAQVARTLGADGDCRSAEDNHGSPLSRGDLGAILLIGAQVDQ